MRGHQRICRGARTAGLALTDFQRAICRLVAEQRKEAGDIDVFHDAEAAVHASFDADRRLLELHGYTVETVRELPGFIEAVVRASNDEVRMEWARDSAFRFFPLMEHQDLGLTLHPFDLASNKVLALVGRLEVRDWVDGPTSGCSRSGCCAERTPGSVPAHFWSMRAGRRTIQRRRSRNWRSRAARPTPMPWR